MALNINVLVDFISLLSSFLLSYFLICLLLLLVVLSVIKKENRLKKAVYLNTQGQKLGKKGKACFPHIFRKWC